MLSGNDRITVLGLGVSGMAAVRLAASKGYQVFGIDESSSPQLEDFADSLKAFPNARVATLFREEALPPSELIVISPGIPETSPLSRLAVSSGARIVSEIDFASCFIRRPMLAVTGTNGKTTVTEMTAAILANAGMPSVPCGNIGHPLSLVTESETGTPVVEVSSFQLQTSANFAPFAAAILNIESDHIDRHADFRHYADAKFSVFNAIAEPSRIILNHCLLGEFQSRLPKLTPLTFSAYSPDADIVFNDGAIEFRRYLSAPVRVENPQLLPGHNIENAMASAALAATLLEPEALRRALETTFRDFRCSPHRQEVFASRGGITFVDDSKATNPSAMIAALKRFGTSKNICLVAGGLDKNMDFSHVSSHFKLIKCVFLAGESKNRLASLWNNDIHCILCETFREAVIGAVSAACSGDVVMLSPGCASMDMFENYKERGEIFKAMVREIIS